MDSLKSLIDAKKYDLVLKLTETSKESSDLFYRVSALICLEKYEDALFVIQDNQEIMQKGNMAALINVHIELLCALQRYEQAYTILEYYSNLPYESQVVEEVLRKMPDVIANEEKRKDALISLNEDELINNLTSKKNDETLFALDMLKKLDAITYLPEISEILTKHPNQTVRSFALMLLVQKEIDRDLQFLSYKGLIYINPKKLSQPFTGNNFNTILRRIDQDFKNTTITQTAAHILSSYAIYTYPHQISDEIEELLGAIYLYSLYLLKDDSTNLDEYAVVHDLDKDKIKQYYDLIDVANNDF